MPGSASHRRRYNFPVPPIARLRAAGVTIACGHDGIRDLWSPFGSGDMLERAMHLAYRSTFRRDEEIEMALEAATYRRSAGARPAGLWPRARRAGRHRSRRREHPGGGGRDPPSP
jgi:Cytosine deaminase and related metal-dependent hydrolases